MPDEHRMELSCNKGISRPEKADRDRRTSHIAVHKTSKKMNSQPHRLPVASLASHWLAVLLVFGATALHAQEGTNRDSKTTNSAFPDPSVRSSKQGDTDGRAPAAQPTTRMIIEMTTGEMHLTSSTVPAEGAISRWFELETASISSRYHFLGNLGGATTANSNQYQVTFKGRVNFDKSGRYNLEAGLFSGNSFTGGWNRSGWGSGKGQSNLFLKQLFFSARPVSGVEIQYGGLYFDRGQSTEVTSYDYDGYLVGERITLNRPRNLYFDEISITYGFLGDFNRPNVFARLHRLGQSNYHEFGVSKQIGERIRTSASYAYEEGEDVLRQAIKVRTPALRLIDSFLFEDYERLSPDPGYGFGVYGEKKLHPRISVGGGYAQIDRNGLNSDRFLQGKRVYLNGHFRLSPEFVLIAGATQAVSALPGLPRTRFDVAFEYDLLHALRKTGLF